MKKIILTGPESVGKSTLSKIIAADFEVPYIPEYARTYIEKLNRACNFSDVEHIGRCQIEEEFKYESRNAKFILLDTDLIITKVWFDLVFNQIPQWVDTALKNTENRLHLLLDTSVEWKADGIRENGGEARDKLFKRYQQELEYYQLPYVIITGNGNTRTHNAKKAIKNWLNSELIS